MSKSDNRMESIWRQQSGNLAAKSDTSEKDRVQWDVIVVGAGMAGILIAWYLKESGKRVLVLEADRIASGQTERTTAKITSQHDLRYSKMIENVGIKKARLYAQANEDAVNEYERLIEKKKIACQFERLSSCLYTMEDENVLLREAEAAFLMGIDAYFSQETELPFEVAGAVYFQNQACFSPLEFLKPLAAELEIREQTKVTAVRGHKVITGRGTFRADKVVIATHYPIINVPGFYFLRQHQERSHVLALTGCKKIQNMYYGIDKDGLSFRQAKDMLLLGGSAERTGKLAGGAYQYLEQAAERYFPDAQKAGQWSAQDCMPHDGIPLIGRYSLFTPHLYVATGFQKWGMTSAMTAAMILRDELCGRKNQYAKLFSPQRLNLKAGIGGLLQDIGMSVKGLALGMFHLPGKRAEELAPGEAGIVRIHGRRCACSCDELGIQHRISARCPHLGCELTWNPDEKSWDCPCHGSRFDADGKLLDNPAKKDAQKR